MTKDEKIEKISAAPSCPYDRADLIERVASGRILSAGQARWLSSLGIDDTRIDSALTEQAPEARQLEFESLADLYAMSNQTLGKLLGKKPQTISCYKNGHLDVPPETLAAMRRIIAAIDDAK